MKVSELLDRPEKWCQVSLAQDARRKEVGSLHKDACRWCLVGAIGKCYSVNKYMTYIILLQKVLGVEPEKWNDAPERTFEDVRKLVLQLDI
jgi:hypothetical protein